MLIVLLVLIAIVNYLPALANPEASALGVVAPLSTSATLSNTRPARGSPAPDFVLLDNITSAAMIAAENAALTPPQYLTDLPLVTR